jgi:hypothetical protein
VSVTRTKSFRIPVSAKHVLNAVEQWAEGHYLLRETGSILPGRRMDGVLIPVAWSSRAKAGLYGVEVKIYRSDFLRGMATGQFLDYQSACNSLYIATPRDVCKTSEIPPGIGHLVCGAGDRCVCRRRPAFQDIAFDEAKMWRVVWDLFDQFERGRRAERESMDRLERRMREAAGNGISAMIKAMRTMEASK